jgi:hypothetical protein
MGQPCKLQAEHIDIDKALSDAFGKGLLIAAEVEELAQQ